MFLFYKSMACVVKLREISHYKSIESIDDNPYKKFIDPKSKQNCQLSTRYTAEDKRVWYYYKNNYYRIKDGFNIWYTSQTERRIVSTTFPQVITVIAVETWCRCGLDMILWRHMDALSMLYRPRMFTENCTNKAVQKINNFVS